MTHDDEPQPYTFAERSIMRDKNKFGAVLIALLLVGAHSVAADTHVWSRMYGGTSAGSSDIFVARYAAGGQHVWSKRLGSTGSDAGLGVAVDDDGAVILTGYFDGTADFGGGPLVSNGGTDIFLAKYSAIGDHVWSQNFGSTTAESGADIALDASGNIFFTGYFGDTVDFGGGNLTGLGGADIFLVKCDDSGSYIWSVAHGGNDTDIGWNLACSGSDVVLAGYFKGTANFGGSDLTSAGDTDIYLAMYDAAAGAHVWSKHFGSAQDDQPAGVGIDSAGRVALTGYFHDTVDFGGGGRTSVDGDDIFLAQFDSGGNHMWSKRFGGIAKDKIYGLAIDSSDHVVITGGFPNTIDFGGGVLTRAGQFDDLFLARFDALGDHVWSDRFGSALDDAGRAISIDGLDDVVIAGTAETDIDFGGGTLTNQGFYDVFIVKFKPPQATAVPDAPSNLALYQNHPNPFNPSTRIPYSLRHAGHVLLRVYDVSGRLVRALVDDWKGSGPGVAEWDGRNDAGAHVGSGVYFYRLRTTGNVVTRKMVLLR
jgi:hypothetical protein